MLHRPGNETREPHCSSLSYRESTESVAGERALTAHWKATQKQVLSMVSPPTPFTHMYTHPLHSWVIGC